MLMKQKITILILYMFAGICLSSCINNQTNEIKNAETTPRTETDTDEDNRPKIAGIELEEKKFDISTFSIGTQDYVNSKILVLHYRLPQMADYVEIMRCPVHVDLYDSLNSVKLVDVRAGLKTEFETTSIFRSTDFFQIGSGEGCIFVSTGHNKPPFQDTFAESGSYRYLIRPCISPSRLTSFGEGTGTARNCSWRVSISDPERDYVNHSLEHEEKTELMIEQFKAEETVHSDAIMKIAEKAAREIDKCAVEERDRAARAAVKNAWIHLAASVVEVAIEIVTIRSQLKADGKAGNAADIAKYYKSLNPTHIGSHFDKLQLLAAINGASFSQTFQDMFYSQHDMPRSCYAHYEALSLFDLSMQRLFLAYHFRETAQKLHSNAKDITDGIGYGN